MFGCQCHNLEDPAHLGDRFRHPLCNAGEEVAHSEAAAPASFIVVEPDPLKLEVADLNHVSGTTGTGTLRRDDPHRIGVHRAHPLAIRHNRGHGVVPFVARRRGLYRRSVWYVATRRAIRTTPITNPVATKLNPINQVPIA